MINAKTSDLNNWLSESLSGTYGISIDCFQRLREIGYLGNPQSFTGTYMSYIAHEALYFNYEKDKDDQVWIKRINNTIINFEKLLPRTER